MSELFNSFKLPKELACHFSSTPAHVTHAVLPLLAGVDRLDQSALAVSVNVLDRVPVRELPRRRRVALVLPPERDLEPVLLQQRLHLCCSGCPSQSTRRTIQNTLNTTANCLTM